MIQLFTVFSTPLLPPVSKHAAVKKPPPTNSVESTSDNGGDDFADNYSDSVEQHSGGGDQIEEEVIEDVSERALLVKAHFCHSINGLYFFH